MLRAKAKGGRGRRYLEGDSVAMVCPHALELPMSSIRFSKYSAATAYWQLAAMRLVACAY